MAPDSGRPLTRPALALSVFCLSVFLAACGEPPDTHPGQPVTQRRAAFSALVKEFEPLGQLLRKGNPDPRALKARTEAFNQLREAPWAHFTPDSNYPPTRATAAVWERPADFERLKAAFLKGSDALAAAGQSGDVARVKTAYEAVHDTCRECHRSFRK